MSYVAIGKETTLSGILKSVRILDTSNNSYRDIQQSVLKQAILSGNIEIDNIEVEGNRLIGTNGSIDRIPQISNNKSAVTIISQIDDIGYTIADCNGKVLNVKEDQLIHYAEQYGLSNGKIINKEKKFISSISGEYHKTTLDEIKKDSFKYNKYTGELVSKPKIQEVIDSRISSYESGCYKYKIENNLCKKTYSRKLVRLEDLDSSRVVVGSYAYMLITKKDTQKLMDCLAYKAVDRGILESVQNHDITGRYYKDIVLHYDSLAESSKTVDSDGIMLNMQQFCSMNTRLIIYKDILERKIIPLYRIVTPNGIDYICLYDRGKTRTVNIEEIISSIEDYSNCRMAEGRIVVSTLDGVFAYNIEEIYKVYRRDTIKNTKTVKARLLGIKHNEDVSKNGVLRRLETSAKHVIIPEGVTYIPSGSLKGSTECTEITIPESLLRIEATAILVLYSRATKMNLNCVYTVRKMIYTQNLKYTNNTQLKLNIKSPVSKQELSYVIQLGVDIDNILIDNKSIQNKKELANYVVTSIFSSIGRSHILKDGFRLEKRHNDNYYIANSDILKGMHIRNALDKIEILVDKCKLDNKYKNSIDETERTLDRLIAEAEKEIELLRDKNE